MGKIDISEFHDITKFISENKNILWNLSPKELTDHTLKLKMGNLTDNGALAIDTGKFTGRSPKDRFIVKDNTTLKSVDWGIINQPIDEKNYQSLKSGLLNYLKNKIIYGRNAHACADPKFQLNIRLISEYPWSNLFGYNMFLRPEEGEFKKNAVSDSRSVHQKNFKGTLIRL